MDYRIKQLFQARFDKYWNPDWCISYLILLFIFLHFIFCDVTRFIYPLAQVLMMMMMIDPSPLQKKMTCSTRDTKIVDHSMVATP